MSEKTWEEGIKTGAFKNIGTNKKKKMGKSANKHGKTPRDGIREKRMAARRK